MMNREKTVTGMRAFLGHSSYSKPACENPAAWPASNSAVYLMRYYAIYILALWYPQIREIQRITKLAENDRRKEES